MTGAPPPPALLSPGERAYRAYYRHTLHCGTCRMGVLCPTFGRLGRAWRAAR